MLFESMFIDLNNNIMFLIQDIGIMGISWDILSAIRDTLWQPNIAMEHSQTKW